MVKRVRKGPFLLPITDEAAELPVLPLTSAVPETSLG